VAEPSRAVFLSYASQDARAAQAICEALRAAGIEVWFDQSELRGGDAWDQRIRREIRDCILFVPVISANTASRHEGYFRLEWDLADQRSHMIARNHVFILPVCIDTTSEPTADTPESFQRAQWTRLPGGAIAPAFVERALRLMSERSQVETRAPSAATAFTKVSAPMSWSKHGLPTAVTVVILSAVCLAYYRLWIPHPSVSSRAPAVNAVAAGFAPPPHSIAVLPFANLSGDANQEYFSEGLTEELLNALAQINGLQVAARASAFSFKGQNVDIGTIARRLNVAAVLEGSVQRSGNTVRITAELVDSVTGFDLWSRSYDRDLRDELKLEAQIATAVAAALRVELLGDASARIELGGTRNPAAFDAYLRAVRAYYSRREDAEIPSAIAAYTEAIRLDPNFALAYADRSIAFAGHAGAADTAAAAGLDEAKAEADARHALALAPQLAQAHLAFAGILDQTFHFDQARAEYQRALSLSPGATDVLRMSGEFEVWMGNFDQGLARLRRAVVLDPVDGYYYFQFGRSLFYARRYDEALSAYAEAIRFAPELKFSLVFRGLALYMQGNLQAARSSCEAQAAYPVSQLCLAVIYDKLHRHADAEAALAKFQAASGDSGAYANSLVYAQWGDKGRALQWLGIAARLHDGSLEFLRTDPLLDPLRNEARFREIERELKFPELPRNVQD
jgi:TolB-like protein/Flp pilus assembly protein TadD